jgi:pSer/pThr/pTyr-binding forkhead associated (FHA) protein
VNGERVVRPVALRSGDRLMFGNVTFVFSQGPQKFAVSYATPVLSPRSLVATV